MSESVWLQGQPRSGEAPLDEAGLVLDLLQAVPDNLDQVGEAGDGEVGQDAALEHGPDPFHGVEVGGVGGQLEHPQPWLRSGEGAQGRAGVHIEVVPGQHDVAAGQLAVGGDEDVPVLDPGEGLRLALAPAVAVQPADEPAAVAGPVAGQPGHRYPPGAAADADDRGDPAPPPGPRPRRPHRLAAFVFEDDPPAEGRRRPFNSGQVWAFHTSTVPSSRSIARRAPIWHDQPRRCSRYQIPGTVYCTPNFLVTRSRTRASVHRWSCHPAASGPASSTASSAASCPSSSRHRAACPREATPARPPSCQARRHPRTARSLTRSSTPTTADGTRCSNLSTTSSRPRSRRLRPSAVNPPPCAYRIHPAYRQQQDASAPWTSPIKDLLSASARNGSASGAAEKAKRKSLGHPPPTTLFRPAPHNRMICRPAPAQIPANAHAPTRRSAPPRTFTDNPPAPTAHHHPLPP